MESQGLIKDGRPYTVAIKALGDNGQAVRALKLLEVNCPAVRVERYRFLMS